LAQPRGAATSCGIGCRTMRRPFGPEGRLNLPNRTATRRLHRRVKPLQKHRGQQPRAFVRKMNAICRAKAHGPSIGQRHKLPKLPRLVAYIRNRIPPHRPWRLAHYRIGDAIDASDLFVVDSHSHGRQPNPHHPCPARSHHSQIVGDPLLVYLPPFLAAVRQHLAVHHESLSVVGAHSHNNHIGLFRAEHRGILVHPIEDLRPRQAGTGPKSLDDAQILVARSLSRQRCAQPDRHHRVASQRHHAPLARLDRRQRCQFRGAWEVFENWRENCRLRAKRRRIQAGSWSVCRC